MSYIAKSTVQEVIDKIDSVTLVSDYVRLEKRSGSYVGLCPFHNEKTPSFTVNPEKKLYHCFGCGKGGTIISFVMEMDKLTFPEVIELLAKRLGVEIVYENSGGNREEAVKNIRIEELTELYRRVSVSFHHILMEKPQGRAAKDYILSRGISAGTIDLFRLGYAPADRRWLFSFLVKKGYSEVFLASSGLFSEKYPGISFFSDRLMFPIADRQGRTVAFGGRILSGEGPKYLNSKESDIYKKGQTLFALDLALPEIRKTREAYLAEGYMDVIALHQAGITNAVAPLGTAFTDDQARLLRRWADRVYLLFDADRAGQSAAVKGILTCRRNALSCAVTVPGKGIPPDLLENGEIPAVKDPADILRYFGPEALQKSVKCFINDFEYLISYSRSLYDMSDSEGKARAVAFLFPYLEALDSDISRDAAMGTVADAFGVDRAAVTRDFYRRASSGEKNLKEEIPPGQRPIRMKDELFLLTVVSVNDNLYPKFREALSIKEIEDPAAKELFIALEECYRHNESGMEDLLARIVSEDLRNFVIKRGTSKEFSAHPEELVSDGIKRVKQKRLERTLAEIIIKLRIAKNEADGTRLEELLAEKVHIDTELHRLKEDKK
ncbi:MAG: DNA primase [Treponema sp.]|jgi:DNA primase|nr:DNA primase [Treponema sp.]